MFFNTPTSLQVAVTDVLHYSADTEACDDSTVVTATCRCGRVETSLSNCLSRILFFFHGIPGTASTLSTGFSTSYFMWVAQKPEDDVQVVSDIPCILLGWCCRSSCRCSWRCTCSCLSFMGYLTHPLHRLQVSAPRIFFMWVAQKPEDDVHVVSDIPCILLGWCCRWGCRCIIGMGVVFNGCR